VFRPIIPNMASTSVDLCPCYSRSRQQHACTAPLLYRWIGILVVVQAASAPVCLIDSKHTYLVLVVVQGLTACWAAAGESAAASKTSTAASAARAASAWLAKSAAAPPFFSRYFFPRAASLSARIFASLPLGASHAVSQVLREGRVGVGVSGVMSGAGVLGVSGAAFGGRGGRRLGCVSAHGRSAGLLSDRRNREDGLTL
jgi:hypothetical protein